jgi:all-trans-retinol dehydrogenase (NAD+)
MENESSFGLGMTPNLVASNRWICCLAAVGAVAICIAATVACFYTVDWACRAARGRMRLSGRVALVTGAGSGIGRALALELVRRGCHLVLWDLRRQALDDTVRQCHQEAAARCVGGVKSRCPLLLCVGQVLDVSDSEQVDRAVADLQSQRLLVHEGRQRRVSVVVNNCGIVFGKQLQHLTAREMQRTLAVNVFAPMWILHKFIPLLASRGGGGRDASGDGGFCPAKEEEEAEEEEGEEEEEEACIVNVSSLMGSLGAAGLADYSASKWAVNGMHECLRQELAAMNAQAPPARRRRAWRARARPRRVHTLLVSPYVVNTGMFRGAMEKDSVYWWHKWVLPAPLEPEAVAAAIADAMCARRGLLVLPRHLSLVPALLHLLLPQPMYDFVLAVTGGSTGLRHFTGHPPEWNLPPPEQPQHQQQQTQQPQQQQTQPQPQQQQQQQQQRQPPPQQQQRRRR